MQYTYHYMSPLGRMTMGSDGEALIGLWFDDGKYFGNTLTEPTEEKKLPVFEETARWLDIYFNGTNPDFTPTLSLHGTEFQKAVWRRLRDVPYGCTASYGDIASKLPHSSARAVGGAVGRNPISVIVPCHRIVGADGSLTGYAGGIDKKLALLKLEGSSFGQK